MKLIIASKNLHKIREFKAILKPLFSDFDIYSLIDYPDYPDVEEDGTTFEENAQKKALAAAKAFGCHVLADDSGLVIPALHGQPGVHSARFAGEGASDRDNRNKLLEKLVDLPEKERIGYYECVLTLANESGVVKTVKGYCEGYLLCEERGGNGFGYDPLFVKYDYNRTFAELDEATKNRVSHRRKAIDRMIPQLESLLLSVEK